MKKIIGYAFVLLLTGNLAAGGLKTISYSPSDAIIFNQERGFSTQIQSGVTSALINSLKAQKISVIHRIYTFPQFVDKVIPDSYLKGMERDFERAREGGMKLVLRFSYTDRINGKDAALDTILMHIGQLEPILRRNADVIVYVEAGFIGAWGEWYYSSHGLNNTRDRRTMLYALLDALPEERAVVVRTPDYKRRILQDDAPLQENEAFSGSRKSRIGAHNDCFLADADYMLKYDFWYGGSVYQHNGPQINTPIVIDGDMLDWVEVPNADVDEIAEELGGMPTGRNLTCRTSM